MDERELLDLGGVLLDRPVLADVVGAESDDDDVRVTMSSTSRTRRTGEDDSLPTVISPADLGEHGDVGVDRLGPGDDQ